MASRGCIPIIAVRSEVPERGQPKMKNGALDCCVGREKWEPVVAETATVVIPPLLRAGFVPIAKASEQAQLRGGATFKSDETQLSTLGQFPDFLVGGGE